jgi:aminopeptidase N
MFRAEYTECCRTDVRLRPDDYPRRIRMRLRQTASLLVAFGLAGALAVVPATPAAPAPVGFSPGAPGLGDPYFPLEGNGGYEPVHYDLNLSYAPATHRLSGAATILATATQNLSRFDLDLQGLNVRRVTVAGLPASFTRDGQELVITPAFGLPAHLPFVVTVTYDGSPETIVGSPVVFGAPYGWIYTDDGAFVGCEPNAASTWFPSDDHPSRKATFTFRITVPSDRAVMANGDLLGHRTSGGHATYVWNETSPMATYLATIDIGKWQIRQGRTRAGIRETVGLDPALAHDASGIVASTGQVTDYWSHVFGPYAFTSTGAIVDDVPDIGYSLETQTRPLYGFAAGPGTVSHELAHQWFGDSVSVADWREIWLNEGFATFASWLWAEHTGGPTTLQIAKDVYNTRPATSDFWNQSIADPKRDTMFSQAVYERGGMALAMLRDKIGDTDFFRLLRTWAGTHRYGNATTAEFTVLAEKISGRDLTSFFDAWLWQKSRPPLGS